MDWKSKYEIAYSGLKLGTHHFQFVIDNKFFVNFEHNAFKDCDLEVDLAFEKRQSMFVLLFDIGGTISIDCDRCLENFNYPIGGSYEVFVKFGEPTEDIDRGDDIIYLSPAEMSINVAQLIFEFINLSIPIKKAHPIDENGIYACNPKVLKILNTKPQKTNGTDPRWDALKNLKKEK